MKYREALNAALREEMERDPLVFLMGEGIGRKGGSYKVTDKLMDQFGERRVIDTPISEASFVGHGRRRGNCRHPTCCRGPCLVDFTYLVMDQIANQMAKYSFMTGDQGSVPFVLRTQGGTGQWPGRTAFTEPGSDVLSYPGPAGDHARNTL